ncbi:CGA synthase-related protein [Streptomyces netropsis]
MAVLTPGGGPAGTPRRSTPVPPPGAAAPRHRVLLVSRDEELDSLLARRRVAAHLGELTATTEMSGAELPDAALVCDDAAATDRLLELGVPVVHLHSGHPGAELPGAPGRALRRVHRPGWLPGPWQPRSGVRATGVLAPVRMVRERVRSGTLLLLSLWSVPDGEAVAFADGPLRTLVRAAVDGGGRCEVVCDTGLGLVRSALDGIGGPGEGRLSRAAEVDVDALHAAAETFLASPVLGALALAQARSAPLAFLPPLGAAQRDLAARVDRALLIPRAADPGHASSGVPSSRKAVPWSVLDPTLDDLRGAQRVARSLRQLSLAPP